MPIIIEELTSKSLLLRVRFGGTLLGSATGFLIRAEGQVYLVSNLHVFSGRDPSTGACIDGVNSALPDNVIVHHHVVGQPGQFVEVQYDLGEEATPAYLKHERPWDIGLLPIAEATGVDYRITDHHHDTALGAHISVSSPVSVIGFPFGLASHGSFPIWKSGNVAGEVDLPFYGQPCFLIDAATRGGMSGSPVYSLFRGSYMTQGGGTVLAGGERSRFLGVYSGRLVVPAAALGQFSEQERQMISTIGSDIGLVWRPSVIDEILMRARGGA